MADNKPNTVKIPMETVDQKTGEVIKTEMVEMTIAPPPVGSCTMCGVKHHALEAHNADSLFYQYRFYGAHGRWPTWADAIAHCDAIARGKWEQELIRAKVMTLPPDGHAPIAEPYAMQLGGPEGKDRITYDETISPQAVQLVQSLNMVLAGNSLDVCEQAGLNLFSMVIHTTARLRGLNDQQFAMYARAMVESCYQNAAHNWSREAQPTDIPARPN